MPWLVVVVQAARPKFDQPKDQRQRALARHVAAHVRDNPIGLRLLPSLVHPESLEGVTNIQVSGFRHGEESCSIKYIGSSNLMQSVQDTKHAVSYEL